MFVVGNGPVVIASFQIETILAGKTVHHGQIQMLSFFVGICEIPKLGHEPLFEFPSFTVVHQQDNTKDDEVEEGKYGDQGRVGQKFFDPAVVIDPLEEISDHFRVEKTNGELHQFDQKIRE